MCSLYHDDEALIRLDYIVVLPFPDPMPLHALLGLSDVHLGSGEFCRRGSESPIKVTFLFGRVMILVNVHGFCQLCLIVTAYVVVSTGL